MTLRARGAFVFAALVLALSLARSARAGDPRVEWYTVRTPYFRIHYHSGLEALAQRTAGLAEAIRTRLTAPLVDAPTDVTHILLQDTTDSANGSASGVPYNAIRLFVTAPEDQSPLVDYDDWMTELVTHELTHVFHIDTIGPIPSVPNYILGKTYAPNQVQPHWVLEGLAVALESRLTTGGRLRSRIFDMYLRADVLEDNLAGLDRMSHDVRRWPGGDIWYLYGGKFFGWLHDTYGPDVFAAIATVYGDNPFPWGLNRAVSRATGKTYPELYAGWVASLREQYGAAVERVKARGVREGTRLTFSGFSAFNPRFAPPCARKDGREALLYYRDDGHTPPGLYLLPLASRARAEGGEAELVARTAGSPRNGSFDPSCGIVFDSEAPSLRHHSWDDLHYQPPGTTSATGLRGSHERWTTSLRARAPDVSPDGRQVVFSTNHAGTLTLRIADIRPEGGLASVRRLVPSAAGEQAFTPRFSPDGKRVAYSAWTKGGYRDVRVVDVRSGRFFELSHDRANDTQPTWTPDGKHVVWSSDRTGIANIYAYELSTGKVSQITNVINGAFMPEVSPDGRTLFYSGYTSAGYDLFSMPLAEKDWMPAEPAPDDRPDPTPEPPEVDWPVSPYDPWDTLRPYNYSFDYGPGTFGTAISGRVSASDITGSHGVSVSLTQQAGIFTGQASYSYNRLPFGLQMSALRTVLPRTPLVVDGRRYPVRDEALRVATSISYPMPDEFDDQGVSLSFVASDHRPAYAIGAANDPYFDSRSRPRESFDGEVRFGWHYSNVFRPHFGISPERGFLASFNVTYQSAATVSDGTLFAVDGRAVGYLRAPWRKHHVFAVALSGGSASGSNARRGYFFTGGFADTPDLFGSITNALYQSGFVLRGYPPGAFIGRQYNLGNVEYRFPIAWNDEDTSWIDRGVSTLPVFLHGIWGTLFADYGGAYEQIDPKDPLRPFHLGVGAELNLSFTLGYFLDTGLRVGYAKGLSDGAIAGSQTYVVLAASF